MRKHTTLLLLLGLLALLTAAPMTTVYFGTVDDSLGDLTVRSGESPWAFGWEQAMEWGRLQAISFYAGTCVPHLTQTYWGFQAIKILCTFGAAAAFCLLAVQLCRSWRIGVFCALLFFSITQNTRFHNLLNCFPFTFDLAFVLALGSVSAGLAWLRSGRRAWLVLSGILLFFSVWMYEVFLAFVALFPVLAFGFCREEERSMRERLLGCAVPLGAAFLYLAAHLAFKSSSGGEVPGYQKGELFSLLPIQLFGQLTVGSIPGYHWFAFLRDPMVSGTLKDEVEECGGLLAHFLAHVQLIWLVKAVLAGYAAILCLRGTEKGKSPVRSGWILVFGLLLILLPNTIISVIGKYQGYFQEGYFLAHTTSNYAQFGIYLLLALGAVLWLGRVERGLARELGLAAIGTLLAVTTLTTEYWNDHVYTDQALASDKYDLINAFAASEDNREMSRKALVLAPSLWESRGIMGHYDDYWSKYLSAIRKDGNREVFQSEEAFLRACDAEPERKRFLMRWYQEEDGEQFLVVSKLKEIIRTKHEGLVLLSREATVFHNTSDREVAVRGLAFPKVFAPDVTVPAVVTLDDCVSQQTKGPFELHLNPGITPGKDALPLRTVVSCTSYFDPASLTLSRSSLAPPPAVVEILGWKGFHPAEFIESEHCILRWAAGDASLILRNHAPRPTTVQISTSFRARGAREVRVGIPGAEQVLRFDGKTERLYIDDVRVELPPGDTVVPITTDLPPVPPSEDEVRPLAFQAFPWTLDTQTAPRP